MALRSLIDNEQQERFRKGLVLSCAAVFLFIILMLRLVYIQIVQAELNIRMSKENQMRLTTIKAPRGRILDRNGIVIARNRPSYSIYVLPYQLKKGVPVLENLLKIRDSLGVQIFDSVVLAADLRNARFRRFDLTRIKEDVSFDVVSVIEEHVMELPGISVQTEARREYPLGPTTFHALGYISEIPEEEFEKYKEDGYQYGAVIGKAGIERQYESVLRGRDGREYIEVNAYGKSLGIIPDMPHTPPIAGNDIRLSIDAKLQAVADSAFPDSLKGAVIALNPRNGEVLCLYSSPSVDPNIFSLSAKSRSRSWAVVALDSCKPLNNRAISGTYPPGSTFKLVSATAGLASGHIGPREYMPAACHGSYRFGNRVAKCWDSKGHGRITVMEALKKSCNVFFYQVGLKTGEEAINKYASMLGLKGPTGIDLPSEAAGWLSGEESYNRRFKKRGWTWTKGMVLDLAIGQMQVLTPIQLAVMTGGLGNAHHIFRPKLKKEIISPDGNVIEKTVPEPLHDITLDLATKELIHLAMEEVIKPGGTGGRAAVKGIPVGGKTGSAQNPHGELTHGLFVCCAPVTDPVIAMCVVVENAGHGGSVAAPIAGAVLRHFFAFTEEGRAVAAQYTHPGDTTVSP
jgi:penicillin-binding protein 2